jgi:hypothetical protein
MCFSFKFLFKQDLFLENGPELRPLHNVYSLQIITPLRSLLVLVADFFSYV